jgi:hypothetical protein
MIPWVVLAPVIIGGFSARKVFATYRDWRAGETSLTEMLEELGIASLMVSVAAGTMLHPVTAGLFTVVMGSIETRELLQERRERVARGAQPASIEGPKQD